MKMKYMVDRSKFGKKVKKVKNPNSERTPLCPRGQPSTYEHMHSLALIKRATRA
jgi:hypothetical protein